LGSKLRVMTCVHLDYRCAPLLPKGYETY
jgi:hypothetical protein